MSDMNWDKKGEQVANALYPKDCDRDRLRRIGCMTGFNYGVAAALTAMSDDEAVERVAEAIYRSHDSSTHFTAKPWAEMVKSKDRANKFRVKQDRKAARAAITALLEQEPRP